ncbi:hypothetical protein ALC62_03137, partial [Cyphomyrmex costatus]
LEFLIDSGSGPNIIKKRFLNSNVQVNRKNQTSGHGSFFFTSRSPKKLGLKSQEDEFPIPQDGIIGNSLIANIDRIKENITKYIEYINNLYIDQSRNQNFLLTYKMSQDHLEMFFFQLYELKVVIIIHQPGNLVMLTDFYTIN